MITVRLKDRDAVINFPDDTPPEVMKVAIERRFYGRTPDRSLEAGAVLPFPAAPKKEAFTLPGLPETPPIQPPEDYTTGFEAPTPPELRAPTVPSFPGGEDLAAMTPTPKPPPIPRGSTAAAPLEQVPFEAEGIPLQAPTPESLKWLGLPFRPIEWATEKMRPALPEAAGQEAPMNVREVAGMMAEWPAHIPGFQAGLPEAPARPEAEEANKEILNTLGRLAVDAVGWHITGMGVAAALRRGGQLFEDAIRPWVIKERGIAGDPEQVVKAARGAYDRAMKVEAVMADPNAPAGERQAAARAYERLTGKKHPNAPPEEAPPAAESTPPPEGPAGPPSPPPSRPVPPPGPPELEPSPPGGALAKVIPIRPGIRPEPFEPFPPTPPLPPGPPQLPPGAEPAVEPEPAPTPPPPPKPPKEKKQPDTLFGWVRSKGGLHDPTLKGEVAQFVKEFRIVGLVSKKRGMPLDELAAQAVSEGWLPPEARSGDLVEALKQDITGIKTGKRWQKITAEDLDQRMAQQAAREEEGMVAAAQAKVEEVHTGDLDLKVGDEILVPTKDGGEEWLKVKAHDTEKGILTLQDDQIIKVSDVFDYVPVVGGEAFGVKRKGEGAPGTEPAAEKPLWELTDEDLVEVPERKFPRGAYRGEMHDAKGVPIGNVYLHEGRGYVGQPRPYGRGEVIKMLPGSFDPKAFEKAGGLQVSATRRVQYWRFKKPSETPEPAAPVAEKQPWEMARTDFVEQAKKKLAKPFHAEGSQFGTEKEFELKARIAHRDHVTKALALGKPVPPEVLAEYPDLAPKKPPKKYTAEVIKRGLPRDMPDDEKDRLAQLLSEQPDEDVAKLLRANIEQLSREAELKQKVKTRSTATPQDLFAGTEEAPKGQEDLFAGGGKGAASAGVYATGAEQYAAPLKQIIDLPELVELARQLMQGKLPRIVEKIRAHAGQATGIFYPAGLGKILLKADIFKDIAQARAVLAHEIGHLVDYLPDAMLQRGNILGRIAKLKHYMKRTLPRAPGAKTELTEADRVRLRNLAEKIIRAEYKDKWIDEEIVESLPITPEDVLAIWNSVEAALEGNKDLYRFIQTLNTAEKKAIVKQALRGEVAAALQRFAKEVREKTGKKIKAELPPDAVSKKYQELIKAEIEKLKLFKAEEIYDELKALTRAWKPFDPSESAKYTKYRYSGVELYADFVSALFNAPGLAKQMAPNFYEGFFNYLDRNPQFKNLYDQIQADIAAGRTDETLTKRTYEMFRKGDDAYALRYQKKYPWFDAMMRELVDAHWVIQKKVHRIEKVTGQEVPATKNPIYKLDAMTYTGSEIEWMLGQILHGVKRPLEKVGISFDDFGFYRLLKRVAGGRAEVANPQGWYKERAEKKLEALRTTEWGPEKWVALEGADEKFTDTRRYLIGKLRESGRLSADMLETIEDQVKDYSTFDVVHYIRERQGAAPAAKIFSQLGTFQDIANPVTATILKDIAILKAVNRQIAAEATVKFMRENYPLEIGPADTRWNGRFNEIKDPPPGKNLGLIAYLKNGKAQGWYVDKWIADSFERNPIEGWWFAKVLGITTKPFRAVFTDANPGFWMFNVIRDVFRASTNLPQAKFLPFVKLWTEQLAPAFKSVYGIPTDVVEQMQKGNMLISIESVRGMNPEDREIERLLKRYQLMGPEVWHEKIRKPFGEFYNWWTNIGRVFERTTKVAGYAHLRQQFPDAPVEWIRHMVINRAGSPNFLATGRAYPIYNNLLLFSNAMKEGYRSDYHAAAENPGEWWWKKIKYALLGKLLMQAGLAGLIGAGVKMVLQGTSDFDKANYHIIPLGMTPGGKSVYIRIPVDESSRLIGGLVTKMLDRDDPHYVQNLLDYMAGQAPTLHPAIDAMISVVQYASGRNPYDNFRGRYAIPEEIFAARDEHTHEAFLKWLANKSGSSIVYRFRSDDIDQVRGELEEVLNFPIVGNIFGRFVKVSDAGIKQGIQEARELEKIQAARDVLKAKDALTKLINEQPITDDDVVALATKPEVVSRNYIKFISRRYGDGIAEELWSVMQTGSFQEKYAVFKKIIELDAVGRRGEEYRWLWQLGGQP